jgi:hypothetical protein
MLLKSTNRTRVVALALMIAVAVMCAGAAVQPAMAHANGQDCSGPGCDDQLACGQPTQPPATSSPSASISPVAVTVSVGPALTDRGAGSLSAPPIFPSAVWQPFAPSAPRSPPSA